MAEPTQPTPAYTLKAEPVAAPTKTFVIGAEAEPDVHVEDTSIRPFEFHASDEDLADLRRRIAATRWPERETVDDDTQGVRLATIQKLAD